MTRPCRKLNLYVVCEVFLDVHTHPHNVLACNKLVLCYISEFVLSCCYRIMLSSSYKVVLISWYMFCNPLVWLSAYGCYAGIQMALYSCHDSFPI